jgi:hypothetical protein
MCDLQVTAGLSFMHILPLGAAELPHRRFPATWGHLQCICVTNFFANPYLYDRSTHCFPAELLYLWQKISSLRDPLNYAQFSYMTDTVVYTAAGG